MDVNKANFIELLPKIEEAIKKADFIAFDTEFSGLAKDRTFNLFDTQEERYLKIKNTSLDYLLVQLGLAVFYFSNQSKDQFDCEIYNFYIFPYKAIFSLKPYDRSFLVQPSTLLFLVNHGFDFNKWVKEGINYLNMEEEQKFMDTLKKQEEEKQEILIKNYVPEEHKEFIDEFIDSLQKFVNDSNQERLELTPCSAYQRKLIYESAKRSKFENIRLSTCTVSPNSSDRFIAIDKVSKEKQKLDQNNLILETIGISKVIQSLIKSKKPIVGHNVLLDLMHIIHHFIAPLPNSYSSFKNMLKELFPICYDTKMIASAPDLKDLLPNTALHDLFTNIKTLISKPMEIKITNVNNEYFNKPKYHQAGYDAYITGVTFIYLTKYTKENNLNHLLTNSFHFPTFLNKFYFSYSYDITHLDIDLINESIPDRNHVFHLTFPSVWKQSDILELFSPYGSIVIGFINDTSAFVALKDKKKYNEVCIGLKQNEQNSKFSLIRYSDYINNQIKCNNSIKRKHLEVHFSDLNYLENKNSDKKPKTVSSSRSLFDSPTDW